MLIERVSLNGFDYKQINTEYQFKPGMNYIIGSKASGKTILAYSIVSWASAGTWFEQLMGIRSGPGFKHKYHNFHPHQEPIISIDFQINQGKNSITKKFNEEGAECKFYEIDNSGEKVLIDDSRIYLIKKYSNKILYLTRYDIESFDPRTDGLIQFLTKYDFDEDILNPEFISLLNKLLQQYSSGSYWSRHHIYLGGNGEVVSRNNQGETAGLGMPSGEKVKLGILSIVASLMIKNDKTILIADDIFTGLDNVAHASMIECLKENLDNQVILTMYQHETHNIGNLEGHIINLERPSYD